MTFDSAMRVLLAILTLFAISVAVWAVRAHWLRLRVACQAPTSPALEPTVRHIPADGVIPEDFVRQGWVRLAGVFRYQGQLEDAMALPGRAICIDGLRPGESIDLSVMIREPFERARTPGASSAGPVQ